MTDAYEGYYGDEDPFEDHYPVAFDAFGVEVPLETPEAFVVCYVDDQPWPCPEA